MSSYVPQSDTSAWKRYFTHKQFMGPYFIQVILCVLQYNCVPLKTPFFYKFIPSYNFICKVIISVTSMACSLSLAWRARAAAATPVASARSIHALSNNEGKKRKNVFPENEPGNLSKPGVQQQQRRSLHREDSIQYTIQKTPRKCSRKMIPKSYTSKKFNVPVSFIVSRCLIWVVLTFL